MNKIYRLFVWLRVSPNHITFSRFFFVLFGICCFYLNYFWSSFFCIVLGWFTDLIDGHFARSMGLVSEEGKLLDRLSDKVYFIFLIVAYFWITGFYNIALFFVSLVIIFLEFLGILLVIYQKEFEQVKKKGWSAIAIGKRKLVFQAIFSSAFYFPINFYWFKPIILLFSGVLALILTVFSLEYHLKCINKKKFGKFLAVFSVTAFSILLGGIAYYKISLGIAFKEEAILCIFVAAFLDRIDGYLARKFQVSSDKFGLIYDDLADFWNFGIITGIILKQVFFYYSQNSKMSFFIFGFWVLVIFLRLVDFTYFKIKFTISADEFRGLPAPPAALLVLSSCLVFPQFSFLIFCWVIFSGLLASLWILDIRFKKHIPQEKYWAGLSLIILFSVTIKAVPFFVLGIYTIIFVCILSWRAFK